MPVFGLPPAAFGFFKMYYWLWATNLWRKISHLPQIYGTWDVKLTPAGAAKNGDKIRKKKARARIFQQWDKMLVEFETDESQSVSFTAAIVTHRPGRPMLMYAYENEPKGEAPDTMHIHYGAVRLTIESDDKMEGLYFTDKHRTSYGKILFTRVRQENAKESENGQD